MQYSKRKWFPVSTVVLVTATLLYPGIVYVGRATVPALAFVVVALALIVLRVATLRSPAQLVWRMPLGVAAATIVGLAMLDAPLAVKAYPVAVSLTAATVFAATLVNPPSLIERFARLREPDLPQAAQSYCRTVTMVWTVWLTLNTVISAALAVPGNEAVWAIWTGLVAYLVMGALFAGEFAIRCILQRRAAKP
jgi:uncharacterized membrane protein